MGFRQWSSSRGDASLHRCFYAVAFTPEVAEFIAGVIESFRVHRANVAWTRRENIHLTLRFLGEITDAQLAQARTLPGEERAHHGFTLGIRGLGAFPLLRAPRVLWAGVEGETPADLDRLRHLQGRTEVWAREMGLSPENRRYSPHITLGRVRNPPDNLRPLMDDLIARECSSPCSPVSELLLIRSTLGSGGSRYETLERWKLTL